MRLFSIGLVVLMLVVGGCQSATTNEPAAKDPTTSSITDTGAPTTPANITVPLVSSSQIDLTWTASTDGVGVTGYKIYRGGAEVGTSTTTLFSDKNISADTQYCYTVKATDAAGNLSLAADEKCVTSKAVSSSTENDTFVAITGGCFQMGDTFGDGESNEKPVHEVCVENYAIGKYEVTQKEWKDVMDSNPSSFSSCGDNCPVESVSWNDVQGYIQKLNQKTGKTYRLPTEAEWEYAAKNGGKSEKWAGTSTESELEDYAWYYNNSSNTTHPVGQKKPNGLGLYDMSGNVHEWVNDWYGIDYYNSSLKNNPQGPAEGNPYSSSRVHRGGAWNSNLPGFLRTSIRNWATLSVGGSRIGFRLALSH